MAEIGRPRSRPVRKAVELADSRRHLRSQTCWSWKMESELMTPDQSEELRNLREKVNEQRVTIEDLKSDLRHIREQLREALKLLGAN